MISSTILQVENVRKTYYINSGETFEALSGVSFEVKRGEVIGIVGLNGCGKSTLLKIISGITKPTEGKVTVNGKLIPILELGSGFNEELSGRDNVLLTARLMGVKKENITHLMSDIESYSELGKFMDEPVKHYSQGMFLRLAFSLMIKMPVDLLLIDEMLSVGDVSFRLKCKQSIKGLIEEGRSVILVSHNMEELVSLCTRIIIMSHGKISAVGDGRLLKGYVNGSLAASHNAFHQPQSVLKILNNTYLVSGSIKLSPSSQADEMSFFTCSSISIAIKLIVKSPNQNFHFHIDFYSLSGGMICTTSSAMHKGKTFVSQQNGELTATCQIPPYIFNEGVYRIVARITIQLDDSLIQVAINKSDVIFSMVDNPSSNQTMQPIHSLSPFRIPFSWT